MSGNPSIQIERRIPTRREAVIFRFKTALLQARRLLQDHSSSRVRRFPLSSGLSDAPIIASSVTTLWTETDPPERFLVAGKIQNLRIALSHLNGIEIPAGEIFSFWKHVGRATKRRRFVEGRELREGCIIPNVGGGLCQISNALYDAALQANLEIIERHRHTQVVAGSLAEHGRDATVFWNYVDLRFRYAKPFRIDARLDSDNLIVEFRGEKITEKALHQIDRRNATPTEIGSCATCEVGDCHRVVKPTSERNFGRSAWLVDEYTPEFDEYLQRERSNDDLLCLPIDGKRFRKANYAWDQSGFKQVRQSFLITALRSYRSRKLAAQGAARQQNLLAMYKVLAESYAKQLSYDCLHVTVQQNLLPFLWRRGHLGGRTFDVLMTALPMAELQSNLNRAAALHPDSTTLGDFRAEASLVAAESEALKNARRIVTPHSGIASLFGERAVLIDWKIPNSTMFKRAQNDKPTIVFPASTVGRKGCYELRDAIRELDAKLITLGPFIESASFWDGFDVERGSPDWLARADLVVLPAFVEHKPRRLLAAAAAGIPVIASPECGVSNVNGVTVVGSGDAEALVVAIGQQLAK
ncbi:MAG TPA: VanW family protein [Pyrinomonadaceae bacterium]|nr:VanW family protein [Pyrinomonadaceae bacterium]